MKPIYIIRDTFNGEKKVLVNKLKCLIEKCIPEVRVLVVSSEEQRCWVSSNIPIAINLDPFSRVVGHFYLDICRVFNSNQSIPTGFQERRGYLPLVEQLKLIPSGDFILMDDDICTGGTVGFVMENFGIYRPDIKIIKTISLMHEWMKLIGEGYENIYDIVDAHDFIGGLDTSGLMVVDKNGDVERRLYTTNSVDLFFRAKIKDGDLFRGLWNI